MYISTVGLCNLLSNLLVDSVVHGLKILSVRHPGDQQIRLLWEILVVNCSILQKCIFDISNCCFDCSLCRTRCEFYIALVFRS